ncbi:hypothetical protein SOCEGT47_043400 [Sorangium cellulosum]|uniref:Secreted protein n=1 Tax=Sorangium cellulosum TaxID=56 RepID=A0A4P2Q3C2_SORCE|nr:DUF885 domain-containing protein [Sorangium cellulosum]AUX23810.1 hypothetical protein SOCEGT47_043400 [Sorangium cellulosum]
MSLRALRLLALVPLVACAREAPPPAAAPAPPPSSAPAAAASAPAQRLPAWVQRSNEHAEVLLDVLARFSPEHAGALGIERVDREITDLSPGAPARERAAYRAAIAELEERRAAEEDPAVLEDLQILIDAADRAVRGSELDERHRVPYVHATGLVFEGIAILLDDRVAPSRRAAALTRLRRYAGMEAGYEPIAERARARLIEGLEKPGLLAPSRMEIERHLSTNARVREGIGELFRKYAIEGHEAPLAALTRQLEAYDAALRADVLPKARTGFALPPPLYAFALEAYGVDLPPAELARSARAAFRDLQAQMQELAASVARARGLSSSDYRDVIRALKKEQLVGEAILPHYKERLAQIEAIIRRERLVTLPERPARIRLGTAAESAETPAPHMRPPRLLDNRGEEGEFVLPLSLPAPPGAAPDAQQKTDDFTHAAASWTLTAHEARPGHELQFASLVERGVSVARAVFAMNSANVEGWGLYAEAILLPFMPPEGQLISLQFRLLRAARAFLDPELQAGTITPAAARALLTQDVVLSAPFAQSEVERYTFRAPGQATSYFYGFTRLMELRREVESMMGARFDAQRFHDFVLAQGILPPKLMRKAVLERFVRAQPAP